MNKLIHVNSEWPEEISFFELYAGKVDDMSFYTLQANKAISVAKFLKLTSEALKELRNKNELLSDIQLTLDNLVNALIETGVFKTPEYNSLNIL
jgi:predicted transcriptional regulator YheO